MVRKTSNFYKVFVIVIFYQSSGEESPYCGTGSNWQIGCCSDHPIIQTDYLSYVLIL